MRRSGFAPQLLIVAAIVAVIVLCVFGYKKKEERRQVQAAELQAKTAKENAAAALTQALLNIPTPLPPEWQEVVTYLSDVQLPPLPEGWVPVVVVKGTTVHEESFGIVTKGGQFVPVFNDYGQDAVFCFETRFDVGDLLVVLPRGRFGGWAISNDRFHIVKKFAFIPRDPTKRN